MKSFYDAIKLDNQPAYQPIKYTELYITEQNIDLTAVINPGPFSLR